MNPVTSRDNQRYPKGFAKRRGLINNAKQEQQEKKLYTKISEYPYLLLCEVLDLHLINFKR